MPIFFRKNIFLVIVCLLTTVNVSAQVPLANAFAHNDYQHKRPLLDALNYGVANIEADIFLYKNELVVAHFMPHFRKSKTLEKLYLKPLLDRYAADSCIYTGYKKPIVLMIDIKSNSEKTYSKLRVLLEKYKSILTSYDDGIITERSVTVIISGHKPYATMASEKSRLAFIDDDLRNLDKTYIDGLCLMSSAKYSQILSWDGKKPIKPEEKERLCNFVANAHRNGRKVRLWAMPQNPVVWTTLMDCGVDLINSDDLPGMQSYFNITPSAN
jgi:hypothetical protein